MFRLIIYRGSLMIISEIFGSKIYLYITIVNIAQKYSECTVISIFYLVIAFFIFYAFHSIPFPWYFPTEIRYDFTTFNFNSFVILWIFFPKFKCKRSVVEKTVKTNTTESRFISVVFMYSEVKENEI